MKNQTLYRGGENKKPKPTKNEKLDNFIRKEAARRATAAALKKKSE